MRDAGLEPQPGLVGALGSSPPRAASRGSVQPQAEGLALAGETSGSHQCSALVGTSLGQDRAGQLALDVGVQGQRGFGDRLGLPSALGCPPRPRLARPVRRVVVVGARGALPYRSPAVI